MAKSALKLTPGSIDQKVDWCMGTVSHFGKDRTCYVRMDGQSRPRRARILQSAARGLECGTAVLIARPAGDTPVIVGPVSDTAAGADEPRERDLKLTASSSITIECGASSITLREDGRVVIRGKKVISRASGENKLRGYTVKIN